MGPPPSSTCAASGWLLGPPAIELRGRPAIQAWFEEGNAAPRASRRCFDMAAGAPGTLAMTALAMPAEQRGGGTHFMFEAALPGALRVQTREAGAAPDAYSICLPQSGEMAVRHRHGQARAGAGEALIIDPLDVELTEVRAGTHFIEFNLPKPLLAMLGAELAPGRHGGTACFEPLARGAWLERLQFAALQAGAAAHGSPGLFRRWLEMLALTLLTEHGSPQPASGGPPGPPPASLRRALDYMQAHAQEDLLVADIAGAACTSASSLLRLFRAHLGQSPALHLRQIRLDQARGELLRGDAGSVREIAARWGFANASKFSQAYRRRFGEAPAETRRGRRG